MHNDLISRNDLKEDFKKRLSNAHKWLEKAKDEETKIRANAVITYICEVIMTIDNAPTVEPDNKYNIGFYDGFMSAKENIEKEPERPQGKWIRYRDNPHQPEHIKCSNCGQYWSIAEHDKTFDFCFKCGAEMRGGAEWQQ